MAAAHEWKGMKTKARSKERPANKATADQPAEEFIAPEGAHAQPDDAEHKSERQPPVPAPAPLQKEVP